ncbi:MULTISPECIES: aspartyl-phosphate phosphatase Spo0E family protein [unclassified Paenibacillus]|uniref:aspartyl-phosphate phosphatase Spo0E family protein n=1 Tax=unclassified Paenibacillus TaxID=185978 RepID=UPI00278031EE|nr:MULTISPECIES: aspartyl-phosphate phosphatase Spo0E family protein [unclassified Paenibacillus]MDQ0903480.1 hypothetical protein [Paenibacillus sp. V4I7]MDQ0918042.1 hypothetical protein [Paenibacillus sp. V4I5]
MIRLVYLTHRPLRTNQIYTVRKLKKSLIDNRMEKLIQEHDLFLLIQRIKKELENKVISSGYDLHHPEVICISQCLDRLIVEYMKKIGAPKNQT